jgi:hypothetical protein
MIEGPLSFDMALILSRVLPTQAGNAYIQDVPVGTFEKNISRNALF